MVMVNNTTTIRSHLDSEREGLLKLGFSNTEISKISEILIWHETGRSTAATSLGTGVVTGILNNISAVTAHAKTLIPSFKADFSNLFDKQSTAATRLSAVVTLALKATVIIVLGYIVSLEYAQFKAATDKLRAEACSAKLKAIIDTVPMDQLFEASAKLAKECPGQ